MEHLLQYTAFFKKENYDLNREISISFNAANKEGGPNYFQTGETFYAEDLIYTCLMESSNRASTALAELV